MTEKAGYPLSIISHRTSSYQVTVPLYSGPLDLLLQLIERAELDITRLSLAQVTDQYLEHLRLIQDHVAEDLSAFLVIAAKLIQIKSESLLPRPPIRETGEEDLGEALARQLQVYKRYREIANLLVHRDSLGLRCYLRLASPPHIEGVLDLSGFDLSDLSAAAQAILYPPDMRSSITEVVPPTRVSIREKIRMIIHMVKDQGRARFFSIISEKLSRLEIVVTFLAMLELVKRGLVNARQSSLFGEIEIEGQQNLDIDNEFEPEFEE